MYLHKVEGPRSVNLPDGTVLTRADLPPSDTKRWVASRKAMVVRGVLYGLITLSDAKKKYGISDRRIQCLGFGRRRTRCGRIKDHGPKKISTT